MAADAGFSQYVVTARGGAARPEPDQQGLYQGDIEVMAHNAAKGEETPFFGGMVLYTIFAALQSEREIQFSVDWSNDPHPYVGRLQDGIR